MAIDVAKVNEILKPEDRVDTESFPTWDVVDSWIPELYSFLNVAFVAGGGTLPVTGDTATWFDVLVQQKAAYRVLQVRGASKERLSLWQQWNDEWDAAIVKLSDKEQAVAAATALTGFPTSYRDQEPALTREKVY